MSSAESMIVSPREGTPPSAGEAPDRRDDIEGKQAQVAALLGATDCAGLLVLEPENFAWLTAGGSARGILDPREMPALYFSPDQRWILCSNVDSQRIFDEEVDGFGFQLKPWPWQWGREQLLADLCHGRQLACDRLRDNTRLVADDLRRLRSALSPYEQLCLRAVGQLVTHALEATCRTMVMNQTEREVAGQLSHRLLHRGVVPLAISVAADGRSRRYRQCGFTEAAVERYCLVTVTARKYGLCVTANRAVSFGPPEASLRQEHDAACKVHATYIASTWPDGDSRQMLSLGKRVYLVTGFEHEWLLGPQGHITGRSPVEMPLTPQTEELFQSGWAVTWHPSVGAACSCDTFLVTDQGPQIVTLPESWPLKRIRIQGAEFIRPDILERSRRDTPKPEPKPEPNPEQTQEFRAKPESNAEQTQEFRATPTPPPA